MGRRKEAVLCLWAICVDGRKVLLDVVVGNRESLEAWLDCLRGLVARGLRPPVLMTSDGAPGLVAALEQVFPKALRQRCLAHKARNVLAKVSAQDHAQVKADIHSAYYASSQEVACLVATQVVEKWQGVYPTAMASFQEDFEACIAYLRCPANHHKYIRTTNLAERSIEEERRRSKVIPRFPPEAGAPSRSASPASCGPASAGNGCA
jgi:transposase-like protein